MMMDDENMNHDGEDAGMDGGAGADTGGDDAGMGGADTGGDDAGMGGDESTPGM